MTTYKSDRFGDKQLGFALYLIGELIMFATLFATYFLFTPSAINPTPSETFELRTVVITSICLLSSSATIHYAEKAFEKGKEKGVWIGLISTLILATAFMGFEIHEFYKYASEGYTLTENLFLSSFYILVGLHAAHVLFGIGWMALLCYHYPRIPNAIYGQKQKIFTYYWHFVDVIWVFIITFVYGPYLF
ncbi:cytochrome c oxidase subunit 3 [Pontibacillus chungwhensis]|nr:cytochrome c oxidase subunit 3 [Pontibacillus chungwhensis]